MIENTLINQPILFKDGSHLTIDSVTIDGSGSTFVGLSNGKQYQLQKAFPAGTFRFEDDRLNQTVRNHIET